MKVPKMLLHYGLMFTVPTAVAFCYWDPKSDDDIRKAVVRATGLFRAIQRRIHGHFRDDDDVGAIAWPSFAHDDCCVCMFMCMLVHAQEAKVKPDAERRRRNQAKFAELLMQRDAISNESQKQLDDVTAFAKRE